MSCLLSILPLWNNIPWEPNNSFNIVILPQTVAKDLGLMHFSVWVMGGKMLIFMLPSPYLHRFQWVKHVTRFCWSFSALKSTPLSLRHEREYRRCGTHLWSYRKVRQMRNCFSYYLSPEAWRSPLLWAPYPRVYNERESNNSNSSVRSSCHKLTKYRGTYQLYSLYRQ